MATWDQAFEDTPSDTDPGSVIPDKFHELKGATRERIALEHQMVVTEAGATHGRHKLGSARVFVQDTDLSSFEPAVPSPITDIKTGRVLFKPTKKTLHVMHEDTQKEIDYVHKTDDIEDTIVGRKTLSKAPIISEAQLEGSSPNRTYVSGYTNTSTRAPTIDTVEKRIADAITAALITAKVEAVKAAYPVTSTYIQLPGTADPDTLWPVGTYGMTWSHVSSNYAGRFMRIAGGGAVTFNNGSIPASLQDAAIAEHGHTVGFNDSAHDNGGVRLGGSNHDWDTGTRPVGAVVAGSVAKSATENRPANVTIQIWQRTA